ncbi:hypothetical protein CHUAL_004635 [Chamberlinius hualienensis]
MANHYEIPKWAGKPPAGFHLDVSKDGKLIQKLMVDEKKCYLFGRNPQLNDFCIDHASCSRVHSALVYHKHLNRAFLVDLGSTHGTYIGSIRIESNKPTQLPVDSQFHFGASTRLYTLRERPQPIPKPSLDDKTSDDNDAGLLGLPDTETELDNLTEFNTAHNRRISMLGIVDEDVRGPRKRKKKSVIFNEEEEIINPEDIDPTVGRFRNLVQMTVVPTKKRKMDSSVSLSDSQGIFSRRLHQPLSFSNDLYSDLPGPNIDSNAAPLVSPFMFASTLTNKLGLSLPNPAPDVEEAIAPVEPVPTIGPSPAESVTIEPKKKKYAKEAWPGKKPNPSLLM